MSDSWILGSLRNAERKARERSKELRRQANSERRRAMLLHNAADQIEHEQGSIQDVMQPFQKML